jgi:DNA topoisomerase VI subunit A
MAKKTSSKPISGKKKITKKAAAASGQNKADRDERTSRAITTLAESIVTAALAGEEPRVGVPTRSIYETRWNQDRLHASRG